MLGELLGLDEEEIAELANEGVLEAGKKPSGRTIIRRIQPSRKGMTPTKWT